MHFWTRSAQKWVILDGLTHETQPEDLAARVHGGSEGIARRLRPMPHIRRHYRQSPKRRPFSYDLWLS